MSMARRQKAIALAKLSRGEDPGRSRHYIEVIGDDGRWNGKVVLVPEAFDDPRHWREPRMVFVNSMSDLFHEDLAVEDIRRICEVMAAVPRHIYQLLTKRAARMRELLSGPLREFTELPQVWWGVSVENIRHGLPRIEQLRQTPARTRFLSIEPLLEDLGELDLAGIDWVIAGGESGPRSRPMRAEWVRQLRDQCGGADTPFFFKQWGGKNKKKTGRVLDGRTHDDMPRRVPLQVTFA
jgi:protein gp37